MAEIATGNSEDALDILQDSMYKLVQKYAGHDPREWGALFQTILQSRIKDHHRRSAVRNRYRVWFGRKDDDDEEGVDPIQTMADEHGSRPESELEMSASMEILDEAVRQLPARQQQAFMLRALEGLDVAETAKVMKCSEGSVKTHYFRALAVLREKLEDYKL
jgi:RNA polymerase sigma-70 factor (ECF subfamily)